MQARQYNRKQYFEEQSYTTQKFVIPYIEDIKALSEDLKIAEIGCGEGGNLKPFLDRGCNLVGIDLSSWKISLAHEYFENHPLKNKLRLINENIYEVKSDKDLKFDLIILRDTLEHIPDQDLFLEHLKSFLKPGGKVFLAFPAWRMPFGGHQQICRSKILSILPFFHILPRALFRSILKFFGETPSSIESLMEVKKTKISIQKFKRFCLKRNYKFEKLTYFLINPNYEVKFKLKPRKLPSFLNIAYLRDFFVTVIYCVISQNNQPTTQTVQN